MPVPKKRAARDPRLPTGEKPKRPTSPKVLARQEREKQDFERELESAKIEAVKLHAERERAYQLIDHRNTLVRVLNDTIKLRGKRDESRSTHSQLADKPHLPLLDELRAEIDRTWDQWLCYTETHREDWIPTALDGESFDETVDRLLAERGVRPYRHAHKRDKKKETQLRDWRKRLEARIRHARSVLALMKDPYVRDEDGEAVGFGFENPWNAPMHRSGRLLEATDIENEISRLKKILRGLPPK
jgi:hypothetical protein